MSRAGTILQGLDEALKPKDKKVIDAWWDEKPLDGFMLDTDGVKLVKTGMGGQTMAVWKGGKVEFVGKLTGQSDMAILRALKKTVPEKMWVKKP
jgi:hypothetical protein